MTAPRFSLKILLILMSCCCALTVVLRASLPQPPTGPMIDAKVLRTAADGRFEISSGTDDGLKLHAVVAVYRNDLHIGLAKVSLTAPDRAVCIPTRWQMIDAARVGDRVFHSLTLDETAVPDGWAQFWEDYLEQARDIESTR